MTTGSEVPVYGISRPEGKDPHRDDMYNRIGPILTKTFREVVIPFQGDTGRPSAAAAAERMSNPRVDRCDGLRNSGYDLAAGKARSPEL